MFLRVLLIGLLASPIPMRVTPEDQLGTGSHQHHEVLRVERDFGKPWRDIVIDAWVPRAGDKELTEVRLWWIEGDKNDIRRPFGKKTKKRVTVSYDKASATDWDVTFGAGSRKFTFQVVLDDAGKPIVYGNIRAGRKKIDHCRVEKASLYAKKLLDVTVGLDRLEVSCFDDQGRRHKGDLRRDR
jgi:hypothetical protein